MSGSLIILLCTHLLCSCKEFEGNFPRPANISKVFVYEENPNPWVKEACPYINSRIYLRDLVQYVAVEKPQFAKVVIGPKDAGKSTGILKLEKEWKQLGHVIVDVNLKGTSHCVNGRKAMQFISKELMAQIIKFDIRSYSEIYSCTSKKCYNQWSFGVVAMWIAQNINHFLYAAVTIVAMLYRYYDRIQTSLFYRNHPVTFWTGVIAAIAIFAIVFMVWFVFPHVVYEAIQPLNINLESGDWSTLICYMNCISVVKPNNRTILIIREIMNFENTTLQECMKAMERFKENVISFPVILETSDFLWFQLPAIKKSRSSFEPYLTKEMSLKEGEEELVVRTKMFTFKDFRMIYDIIGGHTGSYARLWYYMRYQNMTIADGLERLLIEARLHLRSCLQQSKNITDSFTLLREFQRNGYHHNLTEVSPQLNYLIQCNILFYTGESVIPQKKTMLNAIAQLLSLERDNY